MSNLFLVSAYLLYQVEREAPIDHRTLWQRGIDEPQALTKMQWCYLELSDQHYRQNIKLKLPELLRLTSQLYGCDMIFQQAPPPPSQVSMRLQALTKLQCCYLELSD